MYSPTKTAGVIVFCIAAFSLAAWSVWRTVGRCDTASASTFYSRDIPLVHPTTPLPGNRRVIYAAAGH